MTLPAYPNCCVIQSAQSRLILTLNRLQSVDIQHSTAQQVLSASGYKSLHNKSEPVGAIIVVSEHGNDAKKFKAVQAIEYSICERLPDHRSHGEEAQPGLSALAT